MKTFASIVAVATILSQVAAQTPTLTINTPANLVVCEPAALTWTNDNSGPYFLSILPGNQPSAAPLKQFPPQSGTSVTWNVDIASGTSITLALRDQTGQQVFSSAVTIQSGPNSTCVNTNVQEGGGSGSGSAAAPASTGASSAVASATGGASSVSASAAVPSASGFSTSVAGATQTGSATPKVGGSSSSSSSSSPSASPKSGSNSSSGAIRGSGSVGALCLAGLMGLVGAALL